MSSSASPDLLRLLTALAEAPTASHDDYAHTLHLSGPADIEGWHVAHATAFITQCPPYASIYVGENGQIGGEAAARVAGFRRLLGSEIDDAPDTLAALLYDYAELVGRAASDPRAGHARTAMLWEHLLAWIMPYLDAVQRSAPTPYDDWATLMIEVFTAEACAIPGPGALPLHLRAVTGGPWLAEADTAEAAISALLTPVSSGIVLTRADLAWAVEILGAGLVHNSRAFTLKHLLDQDTAGTLNWLADLARRQAEVRTNEQHALGHVARFWAKRAAATAKSLATMADQAQYKTSPIDDRTRLGV